MKKQICAAVAVVGFLMGCAMGVGLKEEQHIFIAFITTVWGYITTVPGFIKTV